MRFNTGDNMGFLKIDWKGESKTLIDLARVTRISISRLFDVSETEMRIKEGNDELVYITDRHIDADKLLNVFSIAISISRAHPEHDTIYCLDKWIENVTIDHSDLDDRLQTFDQSVKVTTFEKIVEEG